MITLSEDAITQLETLVEEQTQTALADTGEPAAEGLGLRLFVEKGGCAGMQYGMKLDTPQAGDEVVPAGRVSVMIGTESAQYLRGIHIDYADTLNDSGFKITNPNAARSCGCGTSFEAAR